MMVQNGIKVAVCLIALSVFFGCSEEVQISEEKIIRPVRYMILEEGIASKKRSFTGTVVSGKESLLSFKVSGTVKNVHVNVGDIVQSGTLLVQLDETDLQVDLESAMAGLKAAQADVQASVTAVNTSRSNYSRIEKLYESDNVSLSEFEQARGDYETAKAQKKAAESQVKTATSKLQAAKNQLRYATLVAPFEGVINSVEVEENEEISPGSPIVSLSDLKQLEVVVNLSDLYIAQMERGMICQVATAASPDEPLKGTVSEIPYSAINSPTYPVKIRLEKIVRKLRPGMAVDVTFDFSPAETEKKIYLPVGAVGEDGESNFVYSLEKKQDSIYSVHKKKVVLGPMTANGFEVKEGVSSGEILATSGLQILLEGMEVSLLKEL